MTGLGRMESGLGWIVVIGENFGMAHGEDFAALVYFVGGAAAVVMVVLDQLQGW